MTDKIIKFILQGEDQASDEIVGVSSAFSGLGKAALGVGAVAGVAVAGLGAGVVKLAIDSAPLASIAASFDSIAAASGVSADLLLADFKDLSAGMLTNADAMAVYNEAAQLVSPTFANELPEAMGFLSKIAASTGEDMSFLTDSLVTGIGRLSPNILDNLKINVDLAAAYETGADALGINVDEMTKAQQQAALTAHVMELLADNTAALPDVMGTSAQQLAALSATATDLTDGLGVALQPALQALLEPLTELATTHGPAVTEWLGVAAEWLGEKVPLAITTVSDFLTGTLFPAFETVAGFIRDNAVPIMAGLGAILLVTVVPAFIAWAGAAIASAAATALALAPVVIPIVAIGAAVALLVKAWETDWGGIRTTLTGIWTDHLEPIFISLKDWFDKAIPDALNFLADLWENTLKPALKVVWTFISEDLFPLFLAVKELFNVGLTLALTALAGLWQNVLEPALKVVWEFLTEKLQPAFTILKDFFSGAFTTAVDTVKGVLDGLSGAFDGIGTAISTVIGWIDKIITGLGNIQLPDWLMPGSPTPFEMGLRGIGKALKEVATIGMPTLQASLGINGPNLAMVGAGSRVGQGQTYVIHNHFGADSVRNERDILRMADKQEKSLRLRGQRTV